MYRNRIVGLLLLTSSIVSLEVVSEEPLPPRDCTNQASHDSGNAPHTEDVDGDHVGDQCHGKPGDSGSCTVANGTTGQSASVRCSISVNPSKSTRLTCATFITCGPGLPVVSCGGDDWEAWGGVTASGKAYYSCRKGTTETPKMCN